MERFQADGQQYFDSSRDKEDVKQYYKDTNLNETDGKELYHAISSLLESTHEHKIRYSSSDEYLKDRVDLHSDGFLRSLYSAKEADPQKVIEEDMQQMVMEEDQMTKDGHIANVEHVVPQSWFEKDEPMRGDLHHLFYCEKKCNSFRGNKVYKDFNDYTPDRVETDTIRSECGKGIGNQGSHDGQFEPEYGKGQVARATLYFLLRYPNSIKSEYSGKIDIDVLLQWHEKYPPDQLYEKHRNQAIYEIQGNRNPLIDHPELARRIDFSLFRKLH